MAGSIQLDFGNLPLVEAAVRATFTEPVNLRFSVINEILKRLGESFQQLTELQHYEATPGITETVSFHPGRINGVVFADNPNGLRATLQSRVAVVRWVKQYNDEAPEYPRYDVVQSALWQVHDAVVAAYALESLPISVVNMSYVNFIHVTDFSSVLRDYFSKEVQVKATDEAEEIRKMEVSWRENGIDLRFQIEKISATIGEETTDGCRVTTVAGMQVPETEGAAKSTLNDVHARLQVFFQDIISDRAKREWELKGVPGG